MLTSSGFPVHFCTVYSIRVVYVYVLCSVQCIAYTIHKHHTRILPRLCIWYLFPLYRLHPPIPTPPTLPTSAYTYTAYTRLHLHRLHFLHLPNLTPLHPSTPTPPTFITTTPSTSPTVYDLHCIHSIYCLHPHHLHLHVLTYTNPTPPPTNPHIPSRLIQGTMTMASLSIHLLRLHFITPHRFPYSILYLQLTPYSAPPYYNHHLTV